MTSMAKLANSLGGEPVEVSLKGKLVRVKPPKDWRSSAMSAIRGADFEAWAKSSLVNDETVVDGVVSGSNDYDVWKSIDPTLGEIVEFMAAYQAAGGLSLGE
jgi:hypothetical protein